jgi:hypothetical protein
MRDNLACQFSCLNLVAETLPQVSDAILFLGIKVLLPPSTCVH